MTQTRVGIIRGGLSGEYEVSLNTGAAVLRNLPERYKPVDILIDREGVWHVNGVARPRERALAGIDVVFNALHGYYGEDGKLQRFLDRHRIPYTGSGPLASAIGMNKLRTKEIAAQFGLKMPHHAVVRRGEDAARAAHELYRTFPQPSVVKPFDGGSSVGVRIARDVDSLADAVGAALLDSSAALVEEYLQGREATCGVIDNFRGEEYYALPPIEIIPPSGYDFFDYDAKYTGVTQELCPSPHFSKEEKDEIMRMAIAAHKALGLRHYSRSDFIVSSPRPGFQSGKLGRGKRGIYFLEINTLPGLTEESLLPKACNAVGCNFSSFLEHLLTLALRSEK